MARDGMRQVQAFQWQEQQRPGEEPAERDIAVDPFSLRQFSRLDIDRPLPIPSVSIADPHVSPAAGFSRGGSGALPASAASSPRVSIAGRLNALAEATGGWYNVASPEPSVAPPPRGRKSDGGVGEGEAKEEVADDAAFDVPLSSSERKASEPQRWGSDVPLMGADEDYSAGGYSFPKARGKNNNGRGNKEAPFSCCMYVPGLSSRRRGNSPPPPPARSSSSGAFGRATAAAVAEEKKKQYQYTADPASARQSTVSVAVSLERFDCGSLSTSSWGDDLDLDGEVASSSSRFDLLPLELVHPGGDDETDLPVCAAFLFDCDVIRRSVLKKRLADDGAREAAPRPPLGRVSADASGRISGVRVSLKSRSPAPP